MLQRSPDARRRQSGFTLVELLIVIVILGVLAAVVILAIGAFDDRGELAACKADVTSVEVALDAYRADEGRFPESLDDLTKAPGSYLREVPNTTVGSGEYWIVYEPATGTVEGRLKSDEVCAGALAMPAPSATATTPGPGSGTPTPTTTTTTPGGGSPTTTTTPSGGIAQPPGFPLIIQPENMVGPYYQDTLCGDWGDFLGSGDGHLTSWQTNAFSIPSGFTGTYRVTVHVDSNRNVNGLRLRYRNGTSGNWTTVTTWNVGNGCNQTRTADITFTSAGAKQLLLDNSGSWGNSWLLLDAVHIIRIA